MTASTRADLETLIEANFPDNASGFITPAKLREALLDMVDSDLNLEDDSDTGKTTPVAADKFLIRDTEATDAAKYVTLANLFAILGPLIAAATSKATPVDADDLLLSDSAASDANKRLTWANLKATLFSSWGALIAAATGKSTPVDADMILLADSAASNASKKLTWADLKTTINVGEMGNLFRIIGADMNSTADQNFTKIGTFNEYYIRGVRVVNSSGNVSTAQGAIYAGASKTTAVAGGATTSYANMAAANAGHVDIVPTNVGGGKLTLTPILSLTTPQGGAMTADFYIYGVRLS